MKTNNATCLLFTLIYHHELTASYTDVAKILHSLKWFVRTVAAESQH